MTNEILVQEDNKNIIEIILEKLKEINEYYQIIYLIMMMIIFFIVVFILIKNKKIVNKKSKYEYEKNERSGKFISDIYVELGPCNDLIRYMFFGKKWKRRVKQQFKAIIKTNVGKKIKEKCNIKFYNYITFKGLCLSLKKMDDYINVIKDLRFEDDSETNLMYYLGINSYYIKDEVKRLLNNVEMIKNNICFLLGVAGSGKTNLLTYYSKILINNFKEECIYIDSKDVSDNDIESKLLSYFYSGYAINENRKWVVSILLILKKIFRKRIVVVIDAINENSNIEFYKNLSKMLNKYHKNKNMKIIISARTEFYNYRFSEIFEEYLEKDVKYKIISIENYRLSKSIYEKMFLKYKKHFNFNGRVTESVKRTLYSSPVFMRIFFECYKDSNKNISDINKATLFSEYISTLSKKYPETQKLLDIIINNMIDNEKFDYIDKNQIDISFEKIDNLISENVLLTHSIIENVDAVNEKRIETIKITFDEIRDYLITNNLIEKYENGNIDIKHFINNMVEKKYPILEGVLKRLYIYFKQNSINDFCEYILSYKIFNSYSYGNIETYNNFHLNLIFESRQELNEIEVEYLNKLEYLTPNDLGKMIYDGAYNSVYHLLPSGNFIQDKMLHFINENDKTYNFSEIDIDFYKSLIKQLREFDNEEVNQYSATLINLVKCIEGD